MIFHGKISIARLGAATLKPRPTEDEIRDWCVGYLAEILEVPLTEIKPEVSFIRLGLDSAKAAHFILELEAYLGVELTLEIVAEYSSIAALSHYIANLATREGRNNG
jgi:acyl carrier protein